MTLLCHKYCPLACLWRSDDSVARVTDKMAGPDRWTIEYEDAKQLADDTLALIQVTQLQGHDPHDISKAP